MLSINEGIIDAAALVTADAGIGWRNLDRLRRAIKYEYGSDHDDELLRLHRVFYRYVVWDINARAEGGRIVRIADIEMSRNRSVESSFRKKCGQSCGLVQLQEVEVSVNCA